MSSYLSDALRAVWTALKDEDSETAQKIASEHGTWYEETDESRRGLHITKSDCPAVIMTPGLSAITMRPATNRSNDVRIPMDFDLRAEDENVDAPVDFYEMIVNDLETAFEANAFDLSGQAAPYATEIGGAQVRKLYDEADNRLVFVSWQVTFAYTLLFRRTKTR